MNGPLIRCPMCGAPETDPTARRGIHVNAVARTGGRVLELKERLAKAERDAKSLPGSTGAPAVQRARQALAEAEARYAQLMATDLNGGEAKEENAMDDLVKRLRVAVDVEGNEPKEYLVRLLSAAAKRIEDLEARAPSEADVDDAIAAGVKRAVARSAVTSTIVCPAETAKELSKSLENWIDQDTGERLWRVAAPAPATEAPALRCTCYDLSREGGRGSDPCPSCDAPETSGHSIDCDCVACDRAHEAREQAFAQKERERVVPTEPNYALRMAQELVAPKMSGIIIGGIFFNGLSHHDHVPAIQRAIATAIRNAVTVTVERTQPHERDRQLIAAYRAKRAVDGGPGRVWSAVKHWDAEQDVRRLEGEPLMSDAESDQHKQRNE